MNILLIECQMDKHLILNLLYTCVNRHGATHVNHVIRTDWVDAFRQEIRLRLNSVGAADTRVL